MAALQQSVQGLVGVARQRSVASEAYLRQALATLEQMNDPAITAQINLDAVRQNLETSIRMQALSGQLQQVMSQPAGEQRQQRQEALMAQLRQLQGQLRSDVRATPAATVQ
jgi:predicted  nucleic acid-binding Zn-ribbon protein